MTELMSSRYIPSSEASRVVQQYNLGQPMYEYKETVAQKGCGAVVLLSCGAIGLLAGLSSASNTSSSDSSSSGTLIGVSVVLLVLGFLVLALAISKSGNRLFACAGGFMYKRGVQEQVVYWNNVEAIYQRIVEHRGRFTKYKTYNYTIQQFDGTKLTFDDNMLPMEGLCNYIEGSMATRLLPRLTYDYEMGQVVQFGKVAVSKQGISDGKEWLSWDDVDGIRFDNGFITVRRSGKWRNWAIFYTPNIPNFTVLELLIQHIERTRGWSIGY